MYDNENPNGFGSNPEENNDDNISGTENNNFEEVNSQQVSQDAVNSSEQNTEQKAEQESSVYRQSYVNDEHHNADDVSGNSTYYSQGSNNSSNDSTQNDSYYNNTQNGSYYNSNSNNSQNNGYYYSTNDSQTNNGYNYNSNNNNNGNGKKKKKKRGMFRFIVILLLLVVFVLLFQTRSIKVKGNEYYGENSIISWLEKDKLSMNTVYLFWKYNYTDAEVPSVVEEMKLTFENPWTLVAHVKEKGKSGYVSFNDTNLYFDRKGTALFESKKTFTGVPYVEGLSFDASKVEIGKKIPVEDDSAFTLIAEASKYLVKYSLTPDKLVYANEQSVVLYFGSVEVLIGNKEYEIRIAQIKPILEKLKEQYPDQAGVLHLENYEADSASINFTPQS